MSQPVVLPVFHDVPLASQMVRYRPGTGETVEARGPRPAQYDAERPRTVFRPSCLTVAVTGECSLDCSYCYGRDDRGGRRWPGEAAVRAATRLVAGACEQSGRPLTAGLHGSTEALADGDRARQVVEWMSREASAQGVALRLAVTTSGVVEPEVMQWVARTFDAVTVSMDGPPEVHDRHRLDRSGRATWDRVDRSLRELTNGLRPRSLVVRMTVTVESLGSLADDVEWVARRYGPDVVVVQPAYLVPGSVIENERLVGEMARARHKVSGMKTAVVLPHNRPGERHGPFCPPLQDNLLLTPGGRAAWCFAALDGDGPMVGSYDARTDGFELDHERFRELAELAWTPPAACLDCANVRHCSRGCPDRCALTDPPDPAFCSQARADLLERLADARAGDGRVR